MLRTWDIPVPGGRYGEAYALRASRADLWPECRQSATAAITELHVLSPKYAQRDPRITQ